MAQSRTDLIASVAVILTGCFFLYLARQIEVSGYQTAAEALEMKPEELSGELGPLPPMKIHCAELVQGALRDALSPEDQSLGQAESPAKPGKLSPTLQDSLNEGQAKSGGINIQFLDD